MGSPWQPGCSYLRGGRRRGNHFHRAAARAATQRKVSNIGAPDVVGPLDREAAQQVWIHLVTRRRTAQVRFGIVGFDARNAHQPPDAVAAHANWTAIFRNEIVDQPGRQAP